MAKACVHRLPSMLQGILVVTRLNFCLHYSPSKFDRLWLVKHMRGAQTGTFEQDIRIYNQPYINVCRSGPAETGLKSRNVEKRINAV
jgi:hypothetical protein